MNKKLIVGNWKMHLDVHSSSLLLHRLHENLKPHRDIEVVVAPSLVAIQPLSVEIDRRKIKLAAQNAYQKDEGAFTGEVSFTMLRDLVDYVIVGHSERRIYFNESLEAIRDKVQAAIRNGISPILCVGETKGERSAGESRRVVHDQLTSALSNLTPDEVERVTVAYEPVWAISTFDGVLAKPHEIEKMFAMIRSIIRELYGDSAAESVRVLYGGSVDAENANGYVSLEGCDGALVGGASLNYKQFATIVENASRLMHQAEAEHGRK